jgi:putative PIN family toxin of toxin-antitoxin system
VKVVLDTNVLLAAFATRGLCEAVLATCLESHTVITSEHILRELRRHLTGKLKVPARQADATIAFLREQAEVVTPARVPSSACRDRTDLAVLGTAVAAGADCLVTGDRDLLDLETYGFQSTLPRGERHADGAGRAVTIVTTILSPRAFHERLR